MNAKDAEKAIDEATAREDTLKIIEDLDGVIKEMHETMETIREILGEIGKDSNAGAVLQSKKPPRYWENIN